MLKWYARHARQLPWRETKDPYRVWLSEVMLQQTRSATVVPYFERFLARFPDVQALARARIDRVLALWAGLGYYSRARNLHRAAGLIARERGGQFPTCAAEWRALPGVGDYTASAIASIVNGQPLLALDGNLKRVTARVFAYRRPTNGPRALADLKRLMGGHVPTRRAGDFNQALMDLGATVCTPRDPRCGHCPLRADCAARALGLQDELPVRALKKSPVALRVAVVAVRHNGHVLLEKRASGLLSGLWGLLWIETGSPAPRALARKLRAVHGIHTRNPIALGEFEHRFTHRILSARVFGCQLAARPPGRLPNGLRWAPAPHIEKLLVSKADKKAAEILRKIGDLAKRPAFVTGSPW